MNPATEARKALCGKILAIDEARLDSMLAALSLESSADIEARKPLAQPRSRSGRVAVVPVYGFVQQRGDMLSRMFGGVSTEELGGVIDELANDKGIDHIVLDVDSPGGEVSGVQALADKIHATKEHKNIFAISNSLMASAAYWLGSQASELWIAPGAEVGSIGVYSMHTDVSEAEASMGVKRTFIKAGKYKAAGNPYEPMGEEVRARFQSQVNSYYDSFVGAVARGRGVRESAVRNGFGEGMTMLDSAAVQEGMADKVGTLQDLLASLGVKSSSAMARAEADRQTLAHYKARARLAGMSS